MNPAKQGFWPLFLHSDNTKKAILKTQNEEYVYTVIENKPKRVVVETGIVNNGLVQIKKGLKTGDPLIVKGHEYVDENSEVKIVN